MRKIRSISLLVLFIAGLSGCVQKSNNTEVIYKQAVIELVKDSEKQIPISNEIIDYNRIK